MQLPEHADSHKRGFDVPRVIQSENEHLPYHEECTNPILQDGHPRPVYRAAEEKVSAFDNNVFCMRFQEYI